MATRSLVVSAEDYPNRREVLQVYVVFLKLMQKNNIVLSFESHSTKIKYWQGGRSKERSYKDLCRRPEIFLIYLKEA